MQNRIKRALDPQLAESLGLQEGRGAGAVEEYEPHFRQVVIAHFGRVLAELSTADFPFLPAIGEKIRAGGNMYEVKTLAYDVEEGIIEIHVE